MGSNYTLSQWEHCASEIEQSWQALGDCRSDAKAADEDHFATLESSSEMDQPQRENIENAGENFTIGVAGSELTPRQRKDHLFQQMDKMWEQLDTLYRSQLASFVRRPGSLSQTAKSWVDDVAKPIETAAQDLQNSTLDTGWNSEGAAAYFGNRQTQLTAVGELATLAHTISAQQEQVAAIMAGVYLQIQSMADQIVSGYTQANGFLAQTNTLFHWYAGFGKYLQDELLKGVGEQWNIDLAAPDKAMREALGQQANLKKEKWPKATSDAKMPPPGSQPQTPTPPGQTDAGATTPNPYESDITPTAQNDEQGTDPSYG